MSSVPGLVVHLVLDQCSVIFQFSSLVLSHVLSHLCILTYNAQYKLYLFFTFTFCYVIELVPMGC